MEGSVGAEDLGAPESWEAADLEETMSRLMLKGAKKGDMALLARESSLPGNLSGAPSPSLEGIRSSQKVSPEEDVNQVDQFLREALQNPRERLSVLRLEQDVEKFIRDPMQRQMEFQQLPTSYLRLAAHRVAQHYSLQSVVVLDNSLSDGSGSRIIVRKTSECRLPSIRLADIPLSLPSEDSGSLKVAIKQRPQKQSQPFNSLNSNSLKENSSKSVEERKEEYNRARARIFNSASFGGSASGNPDGEARLQDAPQHVSLGVPNAEERISDISFGRGTIESSVSSSRSARTRADKEPIGRYRPNSRVAIFRDREVEKKDPDYDRNYDRYVQRFDPGFGYNGGAYTIQPLYAPAVNYNTEFPQLLPNHSPQISSEHQPRPLPQHLWSAPSTPGANGYGHPETLIPTFGPNHVGARSASAIYLHSQYPGQHPGMPYVHPREHVQHFTQSHQQQADASFGFARPR